MYVCTEFQSVWRTSVFGTKFAPKNTLGWSIWTNTCNLKKTYFK